jgi:hypothetical protein
MAVTARYTAPLQVLEEKAMRDRINAIADAEGVSQASVIRDILRHGIGVREGHSRENLRKAAADAAQD